jgi:putative ABC transport system ATP-binding protein
VVNVSLPSDNPVLDARALSFPADGSVLRQVNLAVGEGETVAVLGPAGAGKTVLLRCLTGRLTPGGGSVWANGKAFHLFSADQRRAFQRRNFGLVPQRTGFVPELTLLQNAALPLVFTGVARDRATARARVWLDRFELGELAGRRVGTLPAEALRRAALARGMVTDPLILFADEPLAGLAGAEVVTITRMLLSIALSHGTAVVCFTREAAMADRFQRRIDLAQGRTPNQPVPAAPARAAHAPKPAPLQPAVVPRMVTVSAPGGGLASTSARGVGPVIEPKAPQSVGMSLTVAQGPEPAGGGAVRLVATDTGQSVGVRTSQPGGAAARPTTTSPVPSANTQVRSAAMATPSRVTSGAPARPVVPGSSALSLSFAAPNGSSSPSNVRVAKPAQSGDGSAAPTAPGGAVSPARPAAALLGEPFPPTNVRVTSPAANPATSSVRPPRPEDAAESARPGPFRPPIPPKSSHQRGGLPLGTPDHRESGAGQVQP